MESENNHLPPKDNRNVFIIGDNLLWVLSERFSDTVGALLMAAEELQQLLLKSDNENNDVSSKNVVH